MSFDMKLRKKTFLLTTLFLAIATTALLAVFRWVVVRHFDQIEEAAAAQAMLRVQQLLQVELDDLRQQVMEYGTRVDFVRLVEDSEMDEAVRENITREALSGRGWSCFVVVKSDCRVAMAGAITSQQTLQSLSSAIVEQLVAATNGPEFAGRGKGAQSIVLLDGQPYLVVDTPIRTRGDVSKPTPVLIVARRFDQAELDRLGRLAGQSVDFLVQGSNPSDRSSAAKNRVASSGEIFMTYDQPGQLKVHAIVSGVSGQAVGVLQITQDRKIHEAGLWFTLVVMGVVIIGEVAIYFFVD